MPNKCHPLRNLLKTVKLNGKVSKIYKIINTKLENFIIGKNSINIPAEKNTIVFIVEREIR